MTVYPSGESGGIADPVYLRVRERIRSEILSGVFPPGSRLKSADLSKRYKVSQMPIREALQMLQGEGLVTVLPNRGASVRAVDNRFIENMYDIRGVIDGLLVRRACKLMNDSEIFELHGVQAKYEEAAGAGQLDASLELNKEFHHIIYVAADNPEAMSMLECHWGLVDSLRRTFGFGQERIQEIISEHRQLLRALDRRDEELATRIALLHCEQAKADLLRQRENALGADPGKLRNIRKGRTA
ncbi:GntR family transcriptional regulator [uncultured Paludibaculum sp.]|uniref:GntR family transcriptional regulator n=1 Tax=uncultured Paludibaculum sp. TaxID=1765020 RepID=UPI002AABECC0|nr:GntR family transcriptional regulator [uncultured Paludibaculum sp.]